MRGDTIIYSAHPKFGLEFANTTAMSLTSKIPDSETKALEVFANYLLFRSYWV